MNMSSFIYPPADTVSNQGGSVITSKEVFLCGVGTGHMVKAEDLFFIAAQQCQRAGACQPDTLSSICTCTTALICADSTAQICPTDPMVQTQ